MASQKTTFETSQNNSFKFSVDVEFCGGSILCFPTWLKEQDLKGKRNSQHCLAFSFNSEVLSRALSHDMRLVMSYEIAVLKQSVIKRKRRYETASVWWANNIAETNCLFVFRVLYPQMAVNLQRTQTVKAHPFRLWKKGRFGTVHDSSLREENGMSFYFFNYLNKFFLQLTS